MTDKIEYARIVTVNGLVEEAEGPGTEYVQKKSSETVILNKLGAKGFTPYLVSEEDTTPYLDKTKVVKEITFRLSRTVNLSD